MTRETKLFLLATGSTLVVGATTVAGALLWKKHPVMGGAVGFFLVGPFLALPLGYYAAMEVAASLPVSQRLNTTGATP